MSAQKVLIFLDDFNIPDLREEFGPEDVLVATFSLVQPNFGTSLATQTITLPADEDNFEQEAKKALYRDVLFKEKVDGKFALRVNVSLADKETNAAKFFKTALRGAATATLGVITGGISDQFVKAIASSLGRDGLKEILADENLKEGKVQSIGSAELNLNAEQLQSETKKIQLGQKAITKRKFVRLEEGTRSGRGARPVRRGEWVDVEFIPAEQNSTSVSIRIELKG